VTQPPLPDALAEALLGALNEAQTAKADPNRFKPYRDDPLGFARDILGVHTLWHKQEDILRAIVNHRRVAVRSGHSVGKTFTLAIAVIWWLFARKGLVVTTASTWHQVERVLWKEIGRLFRAAKVPLPARDFATELRVEPDWYAIGLSTDNPTAFQGHHDPNLLVIADEAPGIPDEIHDAMASLTTGRKNRQVMIGNPTDPSGRFFDAFERGGWKTLHISCLDHPNVVHDKEIIPGAVTREWVEERKVEYGEDSPLFAVRVLGEFPQSSDNQLIDRQSVDRAMVPGALHLDPGSTAAVILGVDVARYGSNRSVCIVRQGNVVTRYIDWQGTNTIETAARVREIFAETQPQPAMIVVDESGVGGGVVDMLLAYELPVVGFMAGNRPSDPNRFDYLRTEGWWLLRERFRRGEIMLPYHEQLRRDLIAPTYSFSPQGKIRAERKDQLLRRGIQSPDFADALMMAFAVDLMLPELAPAPDFSDTSRDPAVIGHGPGVFLRQDTGDDTFGGIPSHWF